MTCNVLFLCTGNSARSIMAEAILARVGGDRFGPFSAGSYPKGEVHPRVIQLLKAQGFQPAAFRSKSWAEFSGPAAPQLDLVFTVCDNAAGEVCPIWAGHPMTVHWGMPDPAAAPETEAERAFEDTWRRLQARITRLCDLPIESLDRPALRHQIEEIGNADGAR